MEENEIVMVTIVEVWDYMLDADIHRVLLNVTPKQCKVLNQVCKQSNLYIEFAMNYTKPKEGDE